MTRRDSSYEAALADAATAPKPAPGDRVVPIAVLTKLDDVLDHAIQALSTLGRRAPKGERYRVELLVGRIELIRAKLARSAGSGAG